MLNFLLNGNCHVYKHELTVLIHHCITISWKASLCLSFCCGVYDGLADSRTRGPLFRTLFVLLICPSLVERRFVWPIYVYSSHGYSSVKSRSNHPIYGRIQMRVSFISARQPVGTAAYAPSSPSARVPH